MLCCAALHAACGLSQVLEPRIGKQQRKVLVWPGMKVAPVKLWRYENAVWVLMQDGDFVAVGYVCVFTDITT